MANRLAVALNDLAESFDRAIRKARTPRIARALCSLRADAEDKLRRAADGDGRSPAEIIGEVLDRIADLIGGSEVMALAKRASGPGHREAAERHPEGEELVAALVALAKEFRDVAERGRKAMKKLGAEMVFNDWEKRYHKQLLEALHAQDLQTAQIVMGQAVRALSALLDEARVDHAIGEPGEGKALIPNFHAFR